MEHVIYEETYRVMKKTAAPNKLLKGQSTFVKESNLSYFPSKKYRLKGSLTSLNIHVKLLKVPKRNFESRCLMTPQQHWKLPPMYVAAASCFC